MNTVEKRAINPTNFCARHPVLLAGRRAYQPSRNNKPPLRFTTSRCNLIRGSFERICSIDVRQEGDRSRMSVSGRQAFETANNSFPRSHRDLKFHREIFSTRSILYGRTCFKLLKLLRDLCRIRNREDKIWKGTFVIVIKETWWNNIPNQLGILCCWKRNEKWKKRWSTKKNVRGISYFYEHKWKSIVESSFKLVWNSYY